MFHDPAPPDHCNMDNIVRRPTPDDVGMGRADQQLNAHTVLPGNLDVMRFSDMLQKGDVAAQQDLIDLLESSGASIVGVRDIGRIG